MRVHPKYFAECSCGYRSSNKRTLGLANGSGLHHLRKIVNEAGRNGVSTRGWVRWVKLEDLPPGAQLPIATNIGVIERTDAPVTPLMGETG
jgi:hypothetical protein